MVSRRLLSLNPTTVMVVLLLGLWLLLGRDNNLSSALVETVTGEEPKLDSKGIVVVQFGQKASKEVESGA